MYSKNFLALMVTGISMVQAKIQENLVQTQDSSVDLSCTSSHPPVWNKYENGEAQNLAFGATKFPKFNNPR